MLRRSNSTVHPSCDPRLLRRRRRRRRLRSDSVRPPGSRLEEKRGMFDAAVWHAKYLPPDRRGSPSPLEHKKKEEVGGRRPQPMFQ